MATETAEDTASVWVYPKERKKARWQKLAAEMDESMSGFIEDMVESGIKQTTFSTEPDKTNAELREELAAVKAERDRARERNRELEDRLHDRERAAIVEHVEDHPGTSFDRLTDHLRATVPSRLNTHLDELAGDVLGVSDEQVYPREEAQAQAQEPPVAAQQGGVADE